MARRFKYEFLKRHPELDVFIKDIRFTHKVIAEASNDPSVSKDLPVLFFAVREKIFESFWEYIYKVSALHSEMELELKFDGDDVYILGEQEVTPQEASRN